MIMQDDEVDIKDDSWTTVYSSSSYSLEAQNNVWVYSHHDEAQIEETQTTTPEQERERVWKLLVQSASS